MIRSRLIRSRFGEVVLVYDNPNQGAICLLKSPCGGFKKPGIRSEGQLSNCGSLAADFVHKTFETLWPLARRSKGDYFALICPFQPAAPAYLYSATCLPESFLLFLQTNQPADHLSPGREAPIHIGRREPGCNGSDAFSRMSNPSASNSSTLSE
jgi:hypothetical protein